MSLNLNRPVTWTAARSAGISRRRLQGPDFRCLLAGVYVPSGITVDARVEGQAALIAAGPGAFLSHHSAARLYGAIVPSVPDLHVSVPPGNYRSSHRQLSVHQSSRSPVRFRGLPVTSPEDTFLDLALTLPLVELVVLGDSLIRQQRTTPEKLLDAIAEPRNRGKRAARRAAQLVRQGVDSPMETRARLLRVLSGLPELETDVRITDGEGRVLRRLDAGDRATRTAVEYDGRHHVQREEQWVADIGRREELENRQWRILTLTSSDLYATPERTVHRLATVFRQRGMKVGPLSDEWRRHFPGYAQVGP